MITSDQITWRSVGTRLEDRLEVCLQSWVGTPYIELERIKAMGVDCIQLVAAFLDEMHRAPAGTTSLPRMSAAAARHRPDLASKVIKLLRRAHSGSTIVRDGIVEPGDVLVVRSILTTDGPEHEGHTMIAGARPYTVYHAVRPRVCQSSCEGWEIMRVYRPKEKQSWT